MALQIYDNDDSPTTMNGMTDCTGCVKLDMESTMLKVGTIITEKIESRGGSAGRCFKISTRHAPGRPM